MDMPQETPPVPMGYVPYWVPENAAKVLFPEQPQPQPQDSREYTGYVPRGEPVFFKYGLPGTTTFVDGDQFVVVRSKRTGDLTKAVQGKSVDWDGVEEWRFARPDEIENLDPKKCTGGPADSLPQDNREYTGGSVSYYSVHIENSTSGRAPYTAECNDIIEALGMNYAEGNAFKAIWRSCAARNLGLSKKGYDDRKYDAEKVVFFGQRMVEQAK